MNHDFYRSLFPILATHTHLSSCSQGALAKPVSKAIEEYHKVYFCRVVIGMKR